MFVFSVSTAGLRIFSYVKIINSVDFFNRN